jgi:hypothetical protein
LQLIRTQIRIHHTGMSSVPINEIVPTHRVGRMLVTLPLIGLTITRRTHQLYSTAAAEFIRWYQQQPEAYSDYSHLDSYLAIYLNLLFRSRVSHLGHANNMVFGLMHLVPALRTRMPISRRCLKGWKKSRVSYSWPPLTWELACMLAVQMSEVGWFDEALALLISYDGYFRISELLATRIRDVMHWTVSEPEVYQIRLKNTKTGPNRLVTLTKNDLGAALITFINTRLDGASSRSRIFHFSARHYRKCFRKGCELLGWESVGFVPHSVRHGHASDDFNSGVPLETIQVRGRWASIDSTRHYIQSSRVHLIRGRLGSTLNVLPDYRVQTVLERMQFGYLQHDDGQSLPQ